MFTKALLLARKILFVVFFLFEAGTFMYVALASYAGHFKGEGLFRFSFGILAIICFSIAVSIITYVKPAPKVKKPPIYLRTEEGILM